MLSSMAAHVREHSKSEGHKQEPKAPENHLTENHIDHKDNIHLDRP